MRGLQATAAVVLVGALSACGSTVSPSAQRAGGLQQGLGGSVAPGAAQADRAALPSYATGTSPGTTTLPGGQAPSGQDTAAVVPTGPVTTGADGVVMGSGVTATTITVGITYTTNGDAANAALGAGGITTGDTRADAQAVVDEVNARGGIHGRRLRPVYYPYDANSTQTRQQQDDAACARFTQDNKVLAVLGSGLSEELTTCLERQGVVHVDSGPIISGDEVYFARHRRYVLMGTLSQDRMMAELVRALVRQRYFTPWSTTTGTPGGVAPVKVGVLSIDIPEWQRPARSVLLPALKAAGYPVAPSDYREIHNPNSQAEDGQTVTDLQSAVLQLHQSGVTHVIFLDSGGSLLLLFGNAARNQGYYPRLGINSGTGAQAVVGEGLATNQQLNGAVGLGWLPSLDLPAADGTRYATAATRSCLELVRRRTGQTFTSTNAASFALGYCDQVLLVAQVLRGTTRLTSDGLMAGIDVLGDRFASAAIPKTFFSPQRHAPAERGWDLFWDTSCTCARYRDPHDVP